MNYRDYAAQYSGHIEAIGGVLYDTVTYLSAATVGLTAFTVARANLSLSNMELAGQLASPKAFLIRAVRCAILTVPWSSARVAAGTIQGGTLNDVAQLLNTGTMQLLIGNKFYCEFPLWMIPGGTGPFGVMAGDGDVADPGEIQDFGTNGVPDINNIRALTKPIFIGPQINFQVNLIWPAALTLAEGNTDIQITFDGDQLRPVQ